MNEIEENFAENGVFWGQLTVISFLTVCCRKVDCLGGKSRPGVSKRAKNIFKKVIWVLELLQALIFLVGLTNKHQQMSISLRAMKR